MIQEKIFGNIGLNKDDDPRYFGENDTDFIQNMIPDMDGDGGNLVTHPGNLEIPTGIAWSITDTQKVIGSCKRVENDIIYYFVKGLSIHGSDITTTTTTSGFDFEDALDNEYNSIIEYNFVTNMFRVIVFEEEFLYMDDWVYGAKVFGEYIIYNSGSHGMRKVNIEYAYKFYNSVIGDKYPAPITSTTFALRNLSPMSRPTWVYATDPSRYQNNLINKTFQFSYRYKYVYGGYSVYSEPSDICLSPSVEEWDGDYVINLYDYNKLTVTFVRGDLDIVEYVEVIVREGNDGDWRFFSQISANDTTVDFYNDEKYESVDQDEVNKIEDAIPLQVADGTLINENRIVVARVTEGFDNIDIDVNMWAVKENITIITPETSLITMIAEDELSWDNEGYGFLTSNLDFNDYPTGSVLDLTFTFGGITGDGVSSYHSNHVFAAGERDTQAHLIATIDAAMTTLLVPNGVQYVKTIGVDGAAAAWNLTHTTNYDIEVQLPFTGTMPLYAQIKILDGTVANGVNKWNTYKSGAVHPHAIEYWDEEFRRSTIQKSAACDVVVRERGYYANLTPATTTTPNFGESLDYRIEVNWEINHLAPTWAKYWSWVYAGNKTQSSFVQYIVNAAPTVNADFYLELDISPLQDLKTGTVTTSFPKSIIDPYVYVAGDRVRIITGAFQAGSLGEPYSGEDYYDLPIAGLDGNILLIPSPNSSLFGAGQDSLIEIYTPRTFEEESELYYLVGNIHEVSAARYHLNIDAGGVSQSVGVPASGTLNSGDAYVIARAFSEQVDAVAVGTLFAVESMHWSDFYISDAYDRGKPNVYSPIGEVTHNSIRWGWKHFDGSSIDNMFTFDPLDYKSTTDIYGAITRIGEMGDVLKVIFKRKVASMYIGKQEYYDSRGVSSVMTSENVLGNPNYSIEEYGTTIPQATIFVKGYCYFIDLYAGSIIRNTNNGSYPISGKEDSGGEGAEYKMHREFRDMCALVLAFGQDNVTTLMGWDDGRKLLYVSILHPSIALQTIAFRESRGRWVAYLDFYEHLTGYYPTCYEYASDKFFSFLDQSDSVWDHSNSGSTALEIYGEPKIAEVSVYGTAQPNKIKVFDAMTIHSDSREWINFVYIPISISYPHGMQSVIPNARFVVRENAMHGDYLFNALTDNAGFNNARLFSGETLRGYLIENLLYTSEAAKLFKVDISFRISEL